jgi:hypothetical protein
MSIIDITLNNYSIKPPTIVEVFKNPKNIKIFFKRHDHVGLAMLKQLGFNFDVAVEEGSCLVRTAKYYAYDCEQCTKSIECDIPTTSHKPHNKKRKMTIVISNPKSVKSPLIKPPFPPVHEPMQHSEPDFEEISLPKGKAAIWEDWEW